jgi:hypothetical protein
MTSPLLNLCQKLCFQEEILKKLSQPFKCPIPNYEGCNSTKNLGIRRSRVRRALYDPNTPNALVLYAPPELSQHEKMKGEGPALVHVVVDPALANILRPHQREVLLKTVEMDWLMWFVGGQVHV